MSGQQSPWPPGVATLELREIGKSRRLTITYKLHAKERLLERGILISDVLYVMKFGNCYTDALPATREGYFRYAMETITPNSNGRKIRAIFIPDKQECHVKVVSVMWVDEKERVAGSIIGDDDE